MIGKLLRSGLYAVPVESATLIRRTRSMTWWRLELECGHSLPAQKKYSNLDDPPRYAGCPEGCGQEIAEPRVSSTRSLARAIAQTERRWLARRRLRSQGYDHR